MTGTHPQRQQAAGPLAAVFVFLAAVLLDLASLSLDELPLARLLFTLAATGILAGALCRLAVLALGSLVGWLERAGLLRQAGLGSAAVWALLPALLAGRFMWELGGGSWISRQWWQMPLRFLGLGAAAGGCLMLARWARKLLSEHAQKLLPLAGGLLALPALATTNHLLLKGLYAPFHHLLLFLYLMDAALVGALLARGKSFSPRAAFSFLGWGLSMAAGGLLVSRTLPGDDPLLASRLLRETPLGSRLLPLLAPAEVKPEQAPPDLLLQLGPRPSLGASRLDALFPGRRRFNLVLVTIDALRFDHIHAYGYRRPITPHLDRFAARGILFKNAYSQFPASSLSMVSMLTGMYPTATGFRRSRVSPASKIPWDSTLAQHFQARGFTTAAILAMPHVQENADFAYLPAGFQHFNEGLPKTGLAGSQVLAAARRFLKENGPAPFFLWVHFFEPHSAYVRHKGFDLGSSAVDRYDSEVAYTDQLLGRLLKTLRQRPDWGRTVVVVHADHGEEFRDHGGLFHGSTLYEEVMHVPLIARLPHVAARIIAAPVELVDLAPTCAELFGLAPFSPCQGQSLLALLVPPERRAAMAPFDPPPAAFMQMRLGQEAIQDAVRLSDWKLIQWRRKRVERLFHLSVDPKETHNLIRSHQKMAARLRGYLAAFRILLKQSAPGADEQAQGQPDPGTLLATLGSKQPGRGLGAALKLLDQDQEKLLQGALVNLLERAPGPAEQARILRLMLLAEPRQGIPRARALLASKDPGVAAAAAILLGVLQDQASLPSLRALATRSHPVPRMLTLVARGFLGDARVLPQLLHLFQSRQDSTRILVVLALASLGERPFQKMAALLAQGAFPDPLTEHLVLRTVSRLPWAGQLPYLASRLLMRPMPETSIRNVLDGAWKQGPLAALPFLQFALASPRRVLKGHAQKLLQGIGRAGWASKLGTMQNLALKTWGMPAAMAEEAAHVVLSAYNVGVLAGLPNWGLLSEAWSYLVLARRLKRARELPRLWPKQAASLPPAIHSFLRRLSLLAESLSRPPKPHLRFVDKPPASRPAQPLWLAQVELRLGPTGGGLCGGLTPVAPRLHVTVTATSSHELARTTFPLPPEGLLPGESLTLLVPVDCSALPEGPVSLSLALK